MADDREQLLELLNQADETLTRARRDAMMFALTQEFGKIEGVSNEEALGLAKLDPVVVHIDAALDMIEQRGKRLRFKDHGPAPF